MENIFEVTFSSETTTQINDQAVNWSVMNNNNIKNIVNGKYLNQEIRNQWIQKDLE